jgi:4-diphosphocytidyl-2-C-methyl-D-erythritol kinase
MKDSQPSKIVIDAPAKLNLGLEIIRRRPDGYHDIATIFLTVGLYDRLQVEPGVGVHLLCDRPELSGEENLIARALDALRGAYAIEAGATVTLDKAIPVASGLGGASSDAAAALLAARELWRLPVTDAALADIALRVGSDVPFFLTGGCALGTELGERLEPLPLPPQTWFVVAAPELALHRKTESLYAALSPSDFSDGLRVATQAAGLRTGSRIDPDLLGNTFARALYARLPSLAPLPETMRACGAPVVAISGAGPAHYTVVDDNALAERIAKCLRTRLGSSAQIFVVAPAPPRTRNGAQ